MIKYTGFLESKPLAWQSLCASYQKINQTTFTRNNIIVEVI